MGIWKVIKRTVIKEQHKVLVQSKFSIWINEILIRVGLSMTNRSHCERNTEYIRDEASQSHWQNRP